MNSEIEELLALQSGVVARHQILVLGMDDNDIRRLLRRRGVGRRAQRGVRRPHRPIDLPPAGVGRRAAGVAGGAQPRDRDPDRRRTGPARRDEHVIHVAVDRDRAFRAPERVVPHRLADLDAKVQWNLSPPRVRIEHAVIDVAAEAPDELAAIAMLSDAVRARRTTVDRILAALSTRSRVARRPFLDSVLRDVAAGTCSVLEHGFLSRGGGLPRAADRPATGAGVLPRHALP